MARAVPPWFYFAQIFIFLNIVHTCTSEVLDTKNGYLEGHMFDSLEIPSAVVCGAKCLQRINCKSFNFRGSDSKCNLNDATKEDFPGDFKPGGDATYHPRQLDIYENSTDPCKDNQCAAGTRCVPNSNSYICVCLPGQVGQYCDKECKPYQTQVSIWDYTFLPEISLEDNIVEFRVQTEKRARLILVADEYPQHEATVSQLYTIDIGRYNNNKTMIKPCATGNTCSEVQTDTPNVLDGENFVDFYVSFFYGHIDVGKVGEKPLLSFIDDAAFVINSIGISSPKSDATWEFCDQRPVWSDWSAWSNECSTTCGNGVRARHRVCGKMTSEFGRCPGDRMEYEYCHGSNRTCPEWSMWSKVSPCSTHTSCGVGTVTRERYCMDGWTSCDGPSQETAACHSPSCQVPWRLVGGSRLGEGRLEVLHDIRNIWGTVNYDGWNSAGTAVACRTLGFVPTPSDPEQGFDQLCDTGWESFNGDCYLGGQSHSKRSFQSAESYCNDKASNLVSILSPAEGNFISTTFFDGSVSDLWIGAHNFYGSSYYYGPYQAHMTWKTGATLTDYDPGFAEQIGSHPGDYQQVCAWLDTTGKWRLSNCDEQRYFACKKSIIQEISLAGKTASQKTTDNGASASRAIDGNTNGDFDIGSCSMTEKKHGQWWKVDLGESVCIGQVVIHNRVDSESDRIVGAKIRIDGHECSGSPITQSHVDAGNVFYIACNRNGQRIEIKMDQKEHLTICEVQAHGCTEGTGCESDWEEYDDHCYQHGTEIKTFEDANTECSDDNALQVTVGSEDEADFLLNNILSSCPNPSYGMWLGAHNGDSFDAGPYTDAMKWVDGSSLTYSPGFEDTIPLFQGSYSRACGYMEDDGAWHLTSRCGRSKYFVCKRKPIFSLEFTPGVGSILLNGMTCDGSEDHLNECTHNGWLNTAGGNHHRDVGLKCGVNGDWNSWTSWSECPEEEDCTPMSESVRTRFCDDPTPILNGAMCDGENSETRSCNCTMEK